MGLEFKIKLSAILATLHATSITLAYIVTQGNITATILWFAISTGITAGLSYYKDQKNQKTKPKTQHPNPKPYQN